MTTEGTCPSCGAALVPARRFRWGAPLATFGIGGLGLSALVVFACLIMIHTGIDRIEGMLLERVGEPHLEVLRVAGVPETILRKIARGDAITEADRGPLDDRQRRLVLDAQRKFDSRRAAIASAAERTRVRFIAIAGAFAVLGALCAPLLLRTTVRACPRCREN
jgi:hypothetical protein